MENGHREITANFSLCGNNILETGEQCDDGNTQNGDCCSSSCQFESNTTVCRASAGICDIAENCTGSSAACPVDVVEPSTTVCRASAGICDLAESCTGSGPLCPDDSFKASTTECRAPHDACDPAEYCTGTGTACPDDVYDTCGGPITSNVVATPNLVEAGKPITLTITATVDDSTTGNSKIKSAKYNINGDLFMPMSATDGSFDSPTENVTANTATLTLPAGVYNICVHGTDVADNTGDEECTFLPVYDPSAGFVTGGGWINSPAGAYRANLSLTGKANFGFVSKYKKGVTVPTGETEFQFKVANLNFHSESYGWLVVAGARAQYKGTGTINGTGNYGFMLTVIDGQINGGGGVDKFRIKIWDKDNGDAIVYDNQIGDTADTADPTTAISGGSIVIHK